MTKGSYKGYYKRPTLEKALAWAGGHIRGIHPACELVIEASPWDFDNIAESIEDNGMLKPIEIDSEGLIVDGRTRLMACCSLGYRLKAKDFVVTEADPWLIAASNYARKNYTPDQRAMGVLNLLQRQAELAKQRRAEGGRKGREVRSKREVSQPDGNSAPKKRRRRTTEIVSDMTGVPRDKVQLANKVSQAAPELAIKVLKGETTLKDAAKSVGLDKQSKKLTARRVVANVLTKLKVAETPPAESDVWKDMLTCVSDLPYGIRKVSMPSMTVYVVPGTSEHPTVTKDGDEWFWNAGGVPEELGDEECRETAECLLVNRLYKRLAGSMTKAG